MWDDEAGYDRDDPKHPDFAEMWLDFMDMVRKREKEGSLSEPGGSPKSAPIGAPATSSPGSENVEGHWKR